MLTDWNAAMPRGGGRRAKAFMTKLEKAKKTPPAEPEPSAAKTVSAISVRETGAGMFMS